MTSRVSPRLSLVPGRGVQYYEVQTRRPRTRISWKALVLVFLDSVMGEPAAYGARRVVTVRPGVDAAPYFGHPLH